MKFNQETIATIGKEATGSVLLASGTITTPVEFLLFTLPVGYTRFRIEIGSYRSLTPQDLIAAVSFDAGDTYLVDPNNWDTYSDIGFGVNSIGGTPSFANDVVEGVLWFQDNNSGVNSTTGQGGTFEVDLYPGNDLEYTHLWSKATGMNSTYGYMYSHLFWGLNPNATNPPPLARATNIMFIPFGNYDFPPTSGNTILAGCTYFLWGVPTP